MSEIQKIDPERKAEWLTALRSGEYNQIHNYLQTPAGHCCLGVITELATNAGFMSEPMIFDDRYTYRDNTGDTSSVLPTKVYEWLGLGPGEETGEPLNEERFNDPLVSVTLEIQERWRVLKLEFLSIGDEIALSTLNDAGFSFNEIADIIEEQL